MNTWYIDPSAALSSVYLLADSASPFCTPCAAACLDSGVQSSLNSCLCDEDGLDVQVG